MARAEVRVAGRAVGRIERGLVLLVAVERGDAEADADVTARKISALRIFPGPTPTAKSMAKSMNRSLLDVGGGCLVVSQFTLAASLTRGNRPSFEPAEAPDRAAVLYERVIERLRGLGATVATGVFGADMAVELVNDGPVTFLVFTRGGRLERP